MSIAKPFTFVANTYAKASEVNADFDVVYSQVNTNISSIAQNATDIDNLENNKANINGSTAQRFAVADAVSNGDAINKQTLFKAISNSLDYVSGFRIRKDSGSPNDTIIVSAGSAYDSTKTVVLAISNSISKQNSNQAANATYYVYVIGNSTGSSTDILISTSSTTPALPSGYTLFRRIGYYTTDGNKHIKYIYDSSGNYSSPVYIIESYASGKSGYVIYSNKLCEQWGVHSSGNTVSLLKEYANTNYNIVCQDNSSNVGTNSNAQGVYGLTKTQFSILYWNPVFWRTIGYIS